MTAPLQLWGTLPTPFDERGELELGAAAHLFDYFGERNFTGLVLLAEVAEAHLISEEEKGKLLALAGQRLAGKLPFWVAVRPPSTRSATVLVQQAEQAGASGFLVGLDRIAGVGYPDLYRHIERIARVTERPLALYTRPGDLVWSLAPEEQKALLEHSRMTGAWVAEGGIVSTEAWVRMAGEKSVWGAGTFELARLAEAGACGVVCALPLLAPEPARAIADAASQGDASRLRKLRSRLKPAFMELGPPVPTEEQGRIERWAEKLARRPLDGGRLRPTASPGLVKAALELQGHRIRPFVRPPLPQVTSEDRSRLKSVLKASGMLG